MADYDLQYQDTHIDALLATANELKTAGYIYKGVATPSTNPGTPTERVAYLASEPGTYTNFGGIVIASGLYSLTYASGTWTGTQMSAGSDIDVVQTTGQSTSDVMSQKAVTDEIMTSPQSWDLSYGGDFTWELGTIHDDGKAYSSSSYYHLYIPVSDIKGWKVKIKAQPTNIATYALLKDIGFAYPVQPLNISSYYCEGYSTTVIIPVGQEATFVIPNDCNYIYISCGQISGVVALPQSNSYYTHKWGDVVQTTGDNTHAVMSQKAVTDCVFDKISLNVSYGGDYTWILGTIHADDKKAHTSSSYYHLNIPISDDMRSKVFSITARQGARADYVFLKDINFTYANGGTNISSHYCDGYDNVMSISAGQTATFTLPQDCNYIYLECGQISTPQVPDNVSYFKEKLDVQLEEEKDIESITFPTAKSYNITDDGHFNSNTGTHYEIPIRAGEKYKVLASASTYSRIWWCTRAANPSNGQLIPFCNGETSAKITGAARTAIYTAPSDAAYMYVDGGDNKPQGIWRHTSLADESAKIDAIVNSIDNIEDLKSASITIPYSSSQAVKVSDGKLATLSGYGHSNYIYINGASKIYVYVPAMASSTYGIAFYYRESDASFCGGVAFSFYKGSTESVWTMYDVPYGANFFRMTMYVDTAAQYKVVVPIDYLGKLQRQSAESIISTQIIRSAKPISDKRYIYAFGLAQVAVIGNKIYVPYGANENTLDGDSVGYPNVGCFTEVDLFDMSHTTINPTTNSTKYSDNTPANPTAIGYTTLCSTPDGNIARFALMRFGNNNPYYCYSIANPTSTALDYVTCRLTYTANGTPHDVDFTINNYRQMLVDMGYATSYVASSADAVDNINIHYDKTEQIYYAVLCGAAAAPSNSRNLPLILMQSTDMATWSPKAYLGKKIDAGEIAAIYKGGIAYVAYRTFSNGMKYLVYDVTNSQTLSDGTFPVSKDLLSKPDAFIFDNNVYLAINVDPTIYGELLNYNSYALDARQEIAIYKVVNGVPVLFRRVNNPTGLQYFAFMETPPMYATAQSVNPMYAQGAIYLAFSEDRRHLYRRQIAQVSFADVTALFADFGRIG